MMGGWRGEEEETSDVLEVKKKKRSRRRTGWRGHLRKRRGASKKKW